MCLYQIIVLISLGFAIPYTWVSHSELSYEKKKTA